MFEVWLVLTETGEHIMVLATDHYGKAESCAREGSLLEGVADASVWFVYMGDKDLAWSSSQESFWNDPECN